jgi:AAA15 family ATPase/GTPase
LATAITEHEKTHTFLANDKTRLLKTTGIYGANGSGKSNIVKALWAMVNFVKSTFEEKKNFNEYIQPFALNTATRNGGTFFQLVFMIDKKRFRYGFVYQKGKVSSEWLFGTANKNEVEYYTREGTAININKERFREGIGLESRTRTDNLFLNVVAEFNGQISQEILIYFAAINIARGNDTIFENGPLNSLSMKILKNENSKLKLLELMQIADSSLVDISENEAFDSKLSHKKLFNENDQEVGIIEMDFDEEASEGTRKLFNYAGILTMLMEIGGVLVIDEFDARFHTTLTKAIVKLFNSDANKTAQLCFVTHDTNLLDGDLLRRDQIYFTEKNNRGETNLYSLAEIKGVRNDALYEKEYIKGKYGAIPFVRNLNTIFE